MEFRVRMAVVGALILGTSVVDPSAAQDPPSLAPGWTREVSRSTIDFVDLRDALSLPWARTVDGGSVMAFRANGDDVLHVFRFDADGGLLARHEAGSPDGLVGFADHVEVRADAAGGAWILADSGPGCALLGISPAGGIDQRLSIEGPCFGFVVLPDGDLVHLDWSGVRRLSPLGAERWRATPAPVAAVRAVMQGTDGDLWIGGSDYAQPPGATLFRVGLDGEPLGQSTALCAQCDRPTALRIEPHPDGGAVMVGERPAFAARFDAAGEAMWFHAFDDMTRIDSVSIDGSGDIYVGRNALIGRSGFGDDRWLLLDAQSGAPRRTLMVEELVAVDAGVVVVPERENFSDFARLQRLDRNGVVLTEVSLAPQGLHYAAFLQAGADDSIEFFAGHHGGPRTPDCAGTPELVRMDAANSVDVLATVCGSANATTPHALLPTADAGVLVAASEFVASFARDGAERWRYDPCPACNFEGPLLWSVVDTRDGGAWVLEQDHSWPSPVTRTLVRIDARGTVVTRQALPEIPSSPDYETIELVADDDDEAVVFWSNPHYPRGTIGWARITRSGSRTSGSIAIAAGTQVGLQQVQRLDDGDFLIAFDPDAYPYLCNLLCEPYFTTLLRVSPHGVPRWRHDVPFEDPVFLLDHSGASWIAAGRSPFTVQSISPLGRLNHTIRVPGLASPFPGVDYPDAVAALPGHHSNRLLVQSAYGAQLVDSAGVPLAATSWLTRAPSRDSPITLSRYGYVTALSSSDGGEHAALYDAFDLRLLATARTNGPPPGRNWAHAYSLATQTSDGAIVVAQVGGWRDGIARTQLSWFGVPGTPSADAAFRDGFED